ncbi:MAG: hypothetical protein EBU46_11580 [Nitrosomonadaceae bacterium]|nr:hypothetical protein [Nitrosomonadaceae bacterium]
MKLSAFDDPASAFKCKACEEVFQFAQVKLTQFVIHPADSLGEVKFVKDKTDDIERGGTGISKGKLLTCPYCNTVNLSGFGKASTEEVNRPPSQRKLVL